MYTKARFVFRGWLMLVLLASLFSGAVLLRPIPVAAQAPGQNLLVNGDFEEGGGGAWPFQDGIGEVQVAPGWRAFWLEQPPSYANPSTPNYWARPEFRDTKRIEFAYRVQSGNFSQKYFTFGRQHEAGLYQQVSNITPGTPLRFQVYMQTWSCTAEGEWNHCPTAPLSNKPAPMNTRVGIDPTGGTNPWAPTVVWGPVIETHDTWTLFSVEAVAQASTVTVFTYSRVDWGGSWARLNNDVYVDNASLVATGQAQPTVPPPPPTAIPQPIAQQPVQPQPTPTPRPDGAVVHIVKSGDTLLAIALQYNVTLEQLRRLNAGTLGPNDMIWPGQELVISGTPLAASQPTPQPTPELTTPITLPVETPVGTPEPALPAAPAPNVAALCVLAYHDVNADLIRQPESEGLIPNVTISLVGVNGLAGTYTTDGLTEPYCFQNLQPGNYVLRHTPAAGYAATGPTEWGIMVSGGQTYALELGYSWVGVSLPVEEPETSQPTPSVSQETRTNGTTSTLMTIIRVSGIIVLLLAVGVAVLFVMSRRG